jgi:glycosyltransferase involved in cell wall biosynthesis
VSTGLEPSARVTGDSQLSGTSVLHVLPHRGGGGETFLDVLAALDPPAQRRVALSRSRTPLGALPSILPRWAMIAREASRHSLVHVHGDMASILCAPILRARTSVWHTHGLSFLRRSTGMRSSMARAGVRAAVRGASRTICTSNAERDELAAIVDPDALSRIVVVHNGVELQPPDTPTVRSDARAELGIADGDVLCLCVGRLDEFKDPLTLARAAEAAAPDAPVVAAFAGDGPLLSALEARDARALRALGHRGDLPRLFAAADIFVLPSTREGLSMALLEGMSHGLPSVVSDGPGNPEAVAEAGVVFPVGDAEALADVLRRLARDPDERARLGPAARERVEQHFSRAHFLERMAAVYSEVLRG